MSSRKSSGRESGGRIPVVTAGRNALAQGKANVQRQLQEIQLARLATRLRELSTTGDTLRAMGVDPEPYGKELAKQHADLFQQLRDPAPMQAKSLSSRVASLLNQFGEVFNPWQTVLAPNATVGLVQVPHSSNAGGTIGADIFQGDLAVGGDIWASGAEEQWWVNTWEYMVPFPGTPSNFSHPGSLSYRFTVGGGISFYRQDIVSGSVHLYATVFTTDDMVNRPIQFTQPPVSSDFAINAILPVSNVPPTVDAGIEVNGTIALTPGATPAIGILIGLIFSVINGNLQFFPGETGEILLSNPDAKMPSDIGRIEYRRDQPFWVTAVSKLVSS